MKDLIAGINIRSNEIQRAKKIAIDICKKINEESECKAEIEVQGMNIILRIEALGIETKINTKMFYGKTEDEIKEEIISELYRKIN